MTRARWFTACGAAAAAALTWCSGLWDRVPAHDRPLLAIAAVAVFLIVRPLTTGSEKMPRI